MPIQNSVDPIQFQMKAATSGALVTGLGTAITGYIMRDGAAGVALGGTFAELTNGGGTYKYTPLPAEFSGNVYTLRFIGAGAVDTFINGKSFETVLTNKYRHVALDFHRDS